MPKLHRFSFTHHVKATPEQLWALVADHEGMANWTPVRGVTLQQEGSPERNGVGAIRVLRLIGPAIREQITAFEPSHHLAYRMLSGAPVRDYNGEINITPGTVGATFVWSVSFRPTLPGAQFVIAAVIRTAAQALAKRANRG